MKKQHYHNTIIHFMKQIPQDMERLAHTENRRTKLHLLGPDNHKLKEYNHYG